MAKVKTPQRARGFTTFMDRVLAPGAIKVPASEMAVDVRDMAWLMPQYLLMLDEIENVGLRYLEAAPRTAESHRPLDGLADA